MEVGGSMTREILGFVACDTEGTIELRRSSRMAHLEITERASHNGWAAQVAGSNNQTWPKADIEADIESRPGRIARFDPGFINPGLLIWGVPLQKQ